MSAAPDDAKIVLGERVVAFGGLIEPIHRLDVIDRHAATFAIENAEIGLRLGIAALGQRTQPARRLHVVARPVGRYGAVEFRRVGLSLARSIENRACRQHRRNQRGGDEDCA